MNYHIEQTPLIIIRYGKNPGKDDLINSINEISLLENNSLRLWDLSLGVNLK